MYKCDLCNKKQEEINCCEVCERELCDTCFGDESFTICRECLAEMEKEDQEA